MSLSDIPKGLRQRIFDRDAGRCQYCHLAQIGQAAVFHINHVVPRAAGGATEESNLVLQCPHCSLHKSNKLGGRDPLTGTRVSLFHPLQQRWESHFRLDDRGYCHGLTPMGRASVHELHMNDPLPTVARSFQLGLGLVEPSG